MRIKGLFWILTALLLSVLAIITYHAFYTESVSLFFLVEGLVLLTVLYLSVFYRRIIKPLHIIGNGMELLKEQDFSSRLSRVGQKEADRCRYIQQDDGTVEERTTAFKGTESFSGSADQCFTDGSDYVESR